MHQSSFTSSYIEHLDRLQRMSHQTIYYLTSVIGYIIEIDITYAKQRQSVKLLSEDSEHVATLLITS